MRQKEEGEREERERERFKLVDPKIRPMICYYLNKEIKKENGGKKGQIQRHECCRISQKSIHR